MKVYVQKKFTIYLIVPLNKTGSCGIIVILLRRSLRPIVAISIPSNSIFPEVGSINLKKDVANVDLPQPIFFF
jgi:hypothetical protein